MGTPKGVPNLTARRPLAQEPMHQPWVLEQVRTAIRVRRYSLRTEDT